ncbi:MAG: hypothetical protein ACR2F8_14635 [Caulobacteraceae bacterium]
MAPLDELALHHLGRAIKVLLRKTAELSRTEVIADPAEYWAGQMAAFLDGLPLVWPPVVEPRQSDLPFHEPHRVEADVSTVARGGMLGGPGVDLLLQIALETESMSAAFGIPILMRCVPSFGPIPPQIWDELRDAARSLIEFTAAGRLLLIGNSRPFDPRPNTLQFAEDVYAIPAILAAGATDAPCGLSGRGLDHFSYDFASGWVGDPALADRGESRQLEEFLSVFNVGRILRIRVYKVADAFPT